jgi:hypothetical protein
MKREFKMPAVSKRTPYQIGLDFGQLLMISECWAHVRDDRLFGNLMSITGIVDLRELRAAMKRASVSEFDQKNLLAGWKAWKKK